MMKSTETTATLGQSPQKLFLSLRLGDLIQETASGTVITQQLKQRKTFFNNGFEFLNCSFAQTSVNDSKLISTNNR